MIAIIDYGMGNAGSILNMLRRVGGEAVVTSESSELANASALILPGVGAFDNGMEKLTSSGLLPVVRDKVLLQKVPFLGVCLGMQLLFRSSEEGQAPGLGWVPGEVRRFDFGSRSMESLKVPHMGWSEIEATPGNILFRGLEEKARFYFVHSYHVECEDEKHVSAYARYGYRFACAVQHENIFGAQFHPEKSHRFGMTFFRNFLEHVC